MLSKSFLKQPAQGSAPFSHAVLPQVMAPLVDGWDFEHLVSAHNGVLIGNAKSKVAALLAKTDDTLRKLSIKNAQADAERRASAAWDGSASQAESQAGPASDVRCSDCWSDVDIDCG